MVPRVKTVFNETYTYNTVFQKPSVTLLEVIESALFIENRRLGMCFLPK